MIFEETKMRTILLLFVLGILAVVAGCAVSDAIPEDRSMTDIAVVDNKDKLNEMMPQEEAPEGRPSMEGERPDRADMMRESIAACSDLQVGVVCSMDTPRGEIEGICQDNQEGEVACTPDMENMKKSREE